MEYHDETAILSCVNIHFLSFFFFWRLIFFLIAKIFYQISSLCTRHTERSLLQIHRRRWVPYALRTPKFLEAFSKPLYSASPFQSKR